MAYLKTATGTGAEQSRFDVLRQPKPPAGLAVTEAAALENVTYIGAAASHPSVAYAATDIPENTYNCSTRRLLCPLPALCVSPSIETKQTEKQTEHF